MVVKLESSSESTGKSIVEVTAEEVEANTDACGS